MKINFIDLQAQYRHYKEEIDKEIHDVLDTSGYIMGPKVKELEKTLPALSGSGMPSPAAQALTH